MQLCTLADARLSAGLGLDTTYDGELALFIKQVSSDVVKYLGYPVKRATYTSEAYAINQRQNLYLRALPIVSVSTVTLAGVAIAAAASSSDDFGYQITEADKLAGRLYRGLGWQGRYFTRDMTYDPVAGARDILVTYDAGYYLPDDPLYVEDSATALPLAIQGAVIMEVVSRFRLMRNEAEGVQSVNEGQRSVSYKKEPSGVNVAGGLSPEAIGKLNPYKRWITA